MPRITQSGVAGYVVRQEPFDASNLVSTYTSNGAWYVVYSYGLHWPLVAYHVPSKRWYVNDERRSRSTSRHLGLCMRAINASIVMDRDSLYSLINTDLDKYTQSGEYRVKRLGNVVGKYDTLEDANVMYDAVTKCHTV